MAEKSSRNASHRGAVDAVRDAETFVVTLPVVGRIRIPRPDQLAYYGALAGLAALEIIDWPIALAPTPFSFDQTVTRLVSTSGREA